MARTYLPTFLRMLLELCDYMNRWDETIRHFLPPEALTPYETFKDACDGLRAVFPDVNAPL